MQFANISDQTLVKEPGSIKGYVDPGIVIPLSKRVAH